EGSTSFCLGDQDITVRQKLVLPQLSSIERGFRAPLIGNSGTSPCGVNDHNVAAAFRARVTHPVVEHPYGAIRQEVRIVLTQPGPGLVPLNFQSIRVEYKHEIEISE